MRYKEYGWAYAGASPNSGSKTKGSGHGLLCMGEACAGGGAICIGTCIGTYNRTCTVSTLNALIANAAGRRCFGNCNVHRYPS
eukprot:1185072-Prorocentrum_minimum.AAC.4